MDRDTTTPFAPDELRRAFAEVHPWGIAAVEYAPTSATATTATARAELLEGTAVTVQLAERGWTTLDPPSVSALVESRLVPREASPDTANDRPAEQRHFETLDDLLAAISPAFERARIEKLFESLAAVARDRRPIADSDDDDDDDRNAPQSP